ncbi:Asp-tRNA(Asn)/Glu-tRNA(Gln) amidotransferase subunit GatB [Candidatus Woesearchaeota archaeon]|nr:Asp-tRNA(Asn)/Glu-tRNA(Gln) amidotransferase subunit GatB [Candidatus Woesearchaeota archaeon]
MVNGKFNSDVVIGLEIHFQPNLKSKLFCSCATKAETKKNENSKDEPNTRTCVICLGMPGSKPMLNKKALDYGLKLGLALNCSIALELIFSRKSYFYPDLAKNYQISQFELPLGKNGEIVLSSGKKIGIERIHLEEDPASLVHPNTIHDSAYTLIDYNRSGICLIELVTKPEMRSPEEAREFLKKLRTILQYLEIFDEQTGVIKADANISIKESGYVRSEVKNITGFKEIERALLYEVERQKQAMQNNEKLVMDTRGWNALTGKTTRLRTKETEADYGYIIDPDLVPIDITQEMIEKTKRGLPELPDEKIKRFITKHKLSPIDAQVLAMERVLAELFEKVAEEIDPILAAQWLRHELVKVANYHKLALDQLRIEELEIVELLSMVEKKEISDRTAQQILSLLTEKGFSPRQYVKEHKLTIVSDTKELEELCKKAIAESQPAIDDYKAGKEIALNNVVGKVMKYTKGTADAAKVKDMLKKMLR